MQLKSMTPPPNTTSHLNSTKLHLLQNHLNQIKSPHLKQQKNLTKPTNHKSHHHLLNLSLPFKTLKILYFLSIIHKNIFNKTFKQQKYTKKHKHPIHSHTHSTHSLPQQYTLSTINI